MAQCGILEPGIWQGTTRWGEYVIINKTRLFRAISLAERAFLGSSHVKRGVASSAKGRRRAPKIVKMLVQAGDRGQSLAVECDEQAHQKRPEQNQSQDSSNTT